MVSKSKKIVDVSIIIPSKNEGENLKMTVDSILKSLNLLDFEVIVVDDDSKDNSIKILKDYVFEKQCSNVFIARTNSIGAAGARNEGAKLAKGEYLFFCDAHIKVQDGWIDNLVYSLRKHKAGIVAPCITDMKDNKSLGYGQIWDDELNIKWILDKPKGIKQIPIACGCCLGIKKKVFYEINGFNELLEIWGREDEELCLKAWLYGYSIVINPYVVVRHLFRSFHPYRVTTDNVTYNLLCIAYFHFSKDRIIKTIEIAKKDLCYFEAALRIKKNTDSIIKMRSKYFQERIYDDEFFFKKFNIPF